MSLKIILANSKIWCSKMQPVSGNQRPDLLTSLMNMSLVLRCHAICIFDHLCRSSSNVPRLPTFFNVFQTATKPACFCSLVAMCRIFALTTQTPFGATKHCKNTAFCDCSTFSRACIFFLLPLSFLWSSFSSLILPTSASIHIVGSLTSKFPSVLYIYNNII